MSDDATAKARAERFGKLPDHVDPATFVVEIPAIPDATPQPAAPPPAAAPELIAATQLADAQRRRGRREG
jgi:hypothetical protein